MPTAEFIAYYFWVVIMPITLAAVGGIFIEADDGPGFGVVLINLGAVIGFICISFWGVE